MVAPVAGHPLGSALRPLERRRLVDDGRRVDVDVVGIGLVENRRARETLVNGPAGLDIDVFAFGITTDFSSPDIFPVVVHSSI